ncbi:Tetratricopeptide-like helical domain [Lasallia pustulata]|uniref:Tetratricopeptide-like helical domain n=1 Tax=Lasallia pustulata TaxID=136370 RepID=A0A1W5DBN9_9LECA|nr:Tetratricopeptide-like helical domain [Lasallia pustulata]
MSLKQEIETWVQAITHYDNNEFDESLKAFDSIADTSKILFNSGVIHATLGEHDKAVEYYQRAVRLDQYLAVAYFQQGVSNFLMEDFEEALANFNDTLLYLRGNTYIDYEQLGLKFKLFSCEVLFNRGMCYIYLQQKEAGMGDLSYAAKEKVTPDHDVIDEAIREQAEGYTVFSIPVGIVYRPNSAKVKNLKTKNYLGKARLIASSDNNNNTSTGFAGPEITRMKAAVVDLSRDGRPLDSISFAASNLVKPDIKSRTRQRSEPPINRNVFPPTPPPDPDQPVRPVLASTQTSPPTNLGRLTGRANSVKSPPARPEPLDLSKQSPSKPALNKELPRLGTTRTASEPGGPRRNHYSSHSDQDPARPSRGRLFMEATPSRRRDDGDEADIDEYPEELYSMYRLHRRSKESGTPSSQRAGSRTRRRSRSRPRPDSIDEADEDAPPDSGSGGGEDDTRYMIVAAGVGFEGFVGRVREKFAIGAGVKVKVKDEEGDLITLGDRDDWEMAVGMVGRGGGGENAVGNGEVGGEVGKMEVWVQEVL